MLEDKLEVVTGDKGELRGIKHEVKMNNMGVREFARMVKAANKAGKGNFLKECRVVGVIPVILPEGTFTPDKHALNLDKDQLDFLLRQCPDFNTEVKVGRSK